MLFYMHGRNRERGTLVESARFFLFHRVFTLMVSLSSFPEQNELPKTGMIKWFAWGPMAIGRIVTVQTTV